jgi:hypothetical protein
VENILKDDVVVEEVSSLVEETEAEIEEEEKKTWFGSRKAALAE